MTATYEKLGFNLMYPENWKLSDQTDANVPCSFSVETPNGDALWSMHIFDGHDDPDAILKETITTLQETYPDLEVAPVALDFETHDGTAIETLFYCLDFLIRVRLQVVAANGYQLMFWFQSEDREFEKQEPVFKAMAISVLQGPIAKREPDDLAE